MRAMWIMLAITAIIALAIIAIYNRLVGLRQTVNQAWSDIEVQLKQRRDLIPQLVETVKGYAKHERQTFEDVVKARQGALNATTVEGTAAAEGLLTQALGRLFALAEAYPDLKANQNFLQLQDELSSVEDKISAARRFYNNSVQEYNTAREQFPAILIAGPFGFEVREFYESDEGLEDLNQPVQVQF